MYDQSAFVSSIVSKVNKLLCIKDRQSMVGLGNHYLIFLRLDSLNGSQWFASFLEKFKSYMALKLLDMHITTLQFVIDGGILITLAKT